MGFELQHVVVHLVEGALLVEALHTPARVFRHGPAFLDGVVLCRLMEVAVHPVDGAWNDEASSLILKKIGFYLLLWCCFKHLFLLLTNHVKTVLFNIGKSFLQPCL